jgi:hypothetical protein
MITNFITFGTRTPVLFLKVTDLPTEVGLLPFPAGERRFTPADFGVVFFLPCEPPATTPLDFDPSSGDGVNDSLFDIVDDVTGSFISRNWIIFFILHKIYIQVTRLCNKYNMYHLSAKPSSVVTIERDVGSVHTLVCVFLNKRKLAFAYVLPLAKTGVAHEVRVRGLSLFQF